MLFRLYCCSTVLCELSPFVRTWENDAAIFCWVSDIRGSFISFRWQSLGSCCLHAFSIIACRIIDVQLQRLQLLILISLLVGCYWHKRQRLSSFVVLQVHMGTSQLVTRSTRHIVKSCDQLTVVFHGVVRSWPSFSYKCNLSPWSVICSIH